MEVIHAHLKSNKEHRRVWNNSPLPHLTSALFLSLEKTTLNFVNCFFLVVTFLSQNVHYHHLGSLGNKLWDEDLHAGGSLRECRNSTCKERKQDWAEGEGEQEWDSNRDLSQSHGESSGWDDPSEWSWIETHHPVLDVSCSQRGSVNLGEAAALLRTMPVKRLSCDP